MVRNPLVHSLIIACLFFALPAAAQQGAGEEAAGGDKAAAAEDKETGGSAPAAGEAAEGTPASGAATEAGPEDEAPASGISGTNAASTGVYRVQLKGLEQRVNELKERIFRSKARLNLLKETVLHGVIAGSKAVIRHVNEMGSSFRLVKLIYSVDGAQIFAKSDDSGSLNEKKEFDIFNGSIVPGNHTVSVLMVFRGHGYGIFSYLKGYKFTVRSSHTFTAGEGRATTINVRAYEKGNITTELRDRPAIQFKVNLTSIGKGAGK